MKIWVDADACPVPVKEILFRAAERTGVETTLVANQPVRVPASRFVRTLRVPRGFDAADDAIAERVGAGDLVVTADVPLAADVVRRGAIALSPRGELFTEEDIKSRLTMRDFMDTLRASGVDTGGPPALSQADRKSFADHLDRILARRGDGE